MGCEGDGAEGSKTKGGEWEFKAGGAKGREREREEGLLKASFSLNRSYFLLSLFLFLSSHVMYCPLNKKYRDWDGQ